MNLLSVAHVGIRVTDRDRALAFYESLGFQVTAEHPEPRVLIIHHASGIELNLIYNAEAPGPNVLMDLPEKRAGLTHVALQVPSADEAAAAVEALGITLTEGPVNLGGAQRSIFFRDPDRNVIELTQLFDEHPL